MGGVFKSFALVVLISFTGTIAARASETRVALLAETEVSRDSVYLSDLLPPRVPAEVRGSAEKIYLGTAPQLGSARVLAGTTIAGFLNGEGGLRAIEVPPRIVVRRAGRLITREEVVTAIRSALNHNRLPGAELESDDVHMFAPVMVSAADAQLEVTRIDFDAALKQARFLLVSRAERRGLPFLVTADLRGRVPLIVASREIAPGHVLAPGDLKTDSRPANDAQSISPARLEDLLGRHSLGYVAPGDVVRPAESSAVALVMPGKFASLRLFSGSMQMLLDVIPLDRGTLGENIRVKLPGTGRILRACVVGTGRLEARF